MCLVRRMLETEWTGSKKGGRPRTSMNVRMEDVQAVFVTGEKLMNTDAFSALVKKPKRKEKAVRRRKTKQTKDSWCPASFIPERQSKRRGKKVSGEERWTGDGPVVEEEHNGRKTTLVNITK